MPHEPGKRFTYREIIEQYGADDPGKDNGPYYLLHRGEQIVALTLRHRYNPKVTKKHAEIWIGDKENVAAWGKRLAALKDTKVKLPLYFTPPKDQDFIFYGNFAVIGHNTSPSALIAAILDGAPVGLSRIVYMSSTEMSFSDAQAFSEKLETGDVVPIDQTVTLRVHYAKKKTRGTFRTQCSGGCGVYLTDEEKITHSCPGPPRRGKKKKRRGQSW